MTCFAMDKDTGYCMSVPRANADLQPAYGGGTRTLICDYREHPDKAVYCPWFQQEQ